MKILFLSLIFSVSSHAQSNGFSIFKPKAAEDVAYERILSKRLLRPQVGRTKLPIKSESRTLVGLRLTGVFDSDLQTPTNSRLILPLKSKARVDQTITLRIGLTSLNGSPFSKYIPGDISSRSLIGSKDLSLRVHPGDNYLVIQDEMNSLLSQAISDSNWISGSENTLGISISRLDSGRSNFTINHSDRDSKWVELQICNGYCPLVDQNMDGQISISCIGDSNTGTGKQKSWCAYLQDLGQSQNWTTHNHGVGGTYVTRQGPKHLQWALSADHPDAVIMAYGTNDAAAGISPQEVTDAYLALMPDISASSARSFVALSPPHLCYAFIPMPSDPVIPLNQEITDRVNSISIIDFYSIMNPNTDYKDCIHMNDLGQQKRAQAAFDKLMGL